MIHHHSKFKTFLIKIVLLECYILFVRPIFIIYVTSVSTNSLTLDMLKLTKVIKVSKSE